MNLNDRFNRLNSAAQYISYDICNYDKNFNENSRKNQRKLKNL